MAINATDLDSNFKEIEREDGTLESVTEAELDGVFLFRNQDDELAKGETSERVKKFFDFFNLRVALPWLQAITQKVNGFLRDTVDLKAADKANEEKIAEANEKLLKKADIYVGDELRITPKKLITEGDLVPFYKFTASESAGGLKIVTNNGKPWSGFFNNGIETIALISTTEHYEVPVLSGNECMLQFMNSEELDVSVYLEADVKGLCKTIDEALKKSASFADKAKEEAIADADTKLLEKANLSVVMEFELTEADVVDKKYYFTPTDYAGVMEIVSRGKSPMGWLNGNAGVISAGRTLYNFSPEETCSFYFLGYTGMDLTVRLLADTKDLARRIKNEEKKSAALVEKANEAITAGQAAADAAEKALQIANAASEAALAKDTAGSVIELNKNRNIFLWYGTKAEYEAQKDTLPENTDCTIIDDDTIKLVSGTIWVNSEDEGEEELDPQLKAVYSRMSENTMCNLLVVDTDGSSDFKGGNTFLTLHKTNDNFGVITAIKCWTGGMAVEWKREISYGIWHDWGWVNPPMNIGEEYRTTEMHMGKPVYVQLFDVGSNPAISGSERHVSIGSFKVIEKSSFAYSTDTNAYYTLESKWVQTYYMQNSGNISVKTIEEGFQANIYCTLKYVKD